MLLLGSCRSNGLEAQDELPDSAAPTFPSSSDDSGVASPTQVPQPADAAPVGPTSGPEGNASACSVLRSNATAYVAHKKRTLVSPVYNLAGVAADATGLWLLSATHNVATGALVHYNLTTGEVTEKLDPPALFDTLGTGAYGIEVDEQSIWISISGNTNSILRLDRKTGELISRTGSPTQLGPSDLAWFGKELLVSTGTGELFAIDPTLPMQQRSFTSFVPNSARDEGVATCNGMVVWAGLFQGMTVLSGTGDPLATIVASDGTAFSQGRTGPMCFFGNQLVIADATGLQIYDLEAKP